MGRAKNQSLAVALADPFLGVLGGRRGLGGDAALERILADLPELIENMQNEDIGSLQEGLDVVAKYHKSGYPQIRELQKVLITELSYQAQTAWDAIITNQSLRILGLENTHASPWLVQHADVKSGRSVAGGVHNRLVHIQDLNIMTDTDQLIPALCGKTSVKSRSASRGMWRSPSRYSSETDSRYK
jgi:hypothetical protein